MADNNSISQLIPEIAVDNPENKVDISQLSVETNSDSGSDIIGQLPLEINSNGGTSFVSQFTLELNAIIPSGDSISQLVIELGRKIDHTVAKKQKPQGGFTG